MCQKLQTKQPEQKKNTVSISIPRQPQGLQAEQPVPKTVKIHFEQTEAQTVKRDIFHKKLCFPYEDTALPEMETNIEEFLRHKVYKYNQLLKMESNSNQSRGTTILGQKGLGRDRNFAVALLIPTNTIFQKFKSNPQKAEPKPYCARYAYSAINSPRSINNYFLKRFPKHLMKWPTSGDFLPWNTTRLDFPYFTHTEPKILASLFDDLLVSSEFRDTNTPLMQYDLHLYSERDACPTCTQVINSFFDKHRDQIKKIIFYYSFDQRHHDGWTDITQQPCEKVDHSSVPAPISAFGKVTNARERKVFPQLQPKKSVPISESKKSTLKAPIFPTFKIPVHKPTPPSVVPATNVLQQRISLKSPVAAAGVLSPAQQESVEKEIRTHSLSVDSMDGSPKRRVVKDD